ncbi:pyridoxal 5'-phosphate synthase glutaminase subunit PdxT [candidate division GN15 bacterium]|nr:pyridoxal 5'-phosphate synthase glutaminase subunit PdxT [candidate division GN15 bacterium]
MNQFQTLSVGILALQGDFDRHQYQVNLTGAKPVLVRRADHLNDIDALIIPGGESTTMSILLDRFNMRTPVKRFAESHAVWGTCAGMIMLAMDIKDNLSGVEPLKLMDIDVIRNDYGRQVYSFDEQVEANLDGDIVTLQAAFIRAPKVARVGPSVNTLAVFHDSPVLLTQEKLMASSFHTELDDNTRLLEFFLESFVLKG